MANKNTNLGFSVSGLAKVQDLYRSLAGVVVAGLAVPTALGTAGVGVVRFASSAADGMSRLNQKSHILQRPSQELIEFGSLLGSLNLSSSEAGASVEDMAYRISEAMLGLGNARFTLSSFGIIPTDIEGKMRPLADIFIEIVEALEGMPAATQKAYLGYLGIPHDAATAQLVGVKKMKENLMEYKKLSKIDQESNERIMLAHFAFKHEMEKFKIIEKNFLLSMIPIINALTSGMNMLNATFAKFDTDLGKTFADMVAGMIKAIFFGVNMFVKVIGYLSKFLNMLSSFTFFPKGSALSQILPNNFLELFGTIITVILGIKVALVALRLAFGRLALKKLFLSMWKGAGRSVMMLRDATIKSYKAIISFVVPVMRSFKDAVLGVFSVMKDKLMPIFGKLRKFILWLSAALTTAIRFFTRKRPHLSRAEYERRAHKLSRDFLYKDRDDRRSMALYGVDKETSDRVKAILVGLTYLNAGGDRLGVTGLFPSKDYKHLTHRPEDRGNSLNDLSERLQAENKTIINVENINVQGNGGVNESSQLVDDIIAELAGTGLRTD